jgi:uncharacterized membrane protein YsdA (DUF1294 family)
MAQFKGTTRASRTQYQQNNNTRPRAKYQKPWPAMFTIGLLSFIIPALGIFNSWRGNRNSIPLFIYTACSMVSFTFYGYDKYRATNAGWRVRETLLHLFDAVGGWPGGFVAQYHFKHKIRKTSFQLIFWAIVMAHQWFWLRLLLW